MESNEYWPEEPEESIRSIGDPLEDDEYDREADYWMWSDRL